MDETSRAAAIGRRAQHLLLTVALAVIGSLALATGAFAAGAPVTVGTPYAVGQMAVAVDSAGNGIVVWNNDKDIGTATNTVQYCVIAVTAGGCTYSGNLSPADSATYIDNVQVLDDSGTIVILADVDGAAGGSATDFEPEQEWQSTDDGKTFVNVGPGGGRSVAEGDIAGDTAPLSAVILPGTNVLGYGWDSAVSPPTFHAFPLSSPPECSNQTCPAGFANLQPTASPDELGNGGVQYASQGGSDAGVLGIFATDFTDGPFGCSGAQTVPFGFAYAFGIGAQSATNDYNISPGPADSAWKLAATQGDCNVEDEAVDGGASGFGVLETNDLTGQTVYHRFDPAHDTFDTPMVTVSSQPELDPAVTQDASGGVYATYLNGGGGGSVALSYSANGGTTWSGPNALDSDASGDVNQLTSSVNAAGQGWAAWFDPTSGTVVAQSFTATDSIPPPTPTTLTTSQTAGTTTGASMDVPAGTVGETDTAKLAGANAVTATGTVTYNLYTSKACTAASKVDQSAATVTGGVAGNAAPITSVLGVGKYYWQATYSGNIGDVFGAVGNEPSASACGSEVLTIGPDATVGGAATTTSTTVSLTITCASTPCTVMVTITIDPATAASVARKKTKVHHRTITLATGRFTIRHKGARKLQIRLTRAGRKYVAAHHHTLTTSVLVSEKIHGHTELVKRTVRLRFVKASKHHKK
jgi:hypothetical protein